MRHVEVVRFAVVIALATLTCVPARAQAPGRLGERHALLVGVRQYDPNELRSLPYSEPDVTELAQVLKDAGYRQVVTLTQTAGAANFRLLPTAANIRTTLKGMLADRDPGDTVLVAFAGHGVQFQGTQESFFCPMDARLADHATLVSLEEVYRAMERSEAGVKLLLVDSCRNDPQSDNSRSRSLVRLESVTRPQEKRPPGGVAALFSCSPGEKAFEHERLKHGVFYYYVIQGLRGEADLDRDGTVSVEELALFAKKRVPDFVKEEYGFNVRQLPVLRGEIGGLPVLVGLNGVKRPDPPPSRSNLYVLTVGVSAYRTVGKLAYGATDAENLERVFREKSRSLFDRVETKPLTDENATREDIRQGLVWLRRSMTDNDVGIFAFCGREGDIGNGSYCLMPVDADSEQLGATGLVAKDFGAALRGSRGRLLFLLDTCHSEAFAHELMDQFKDSLEFAILASSKANESSFESKDFQGGNFTQAVVEGLAGKANLNHDTVVDFNELEKFVIRRTQEILTELKKNHPGDFPGSQHPVGLTRMRSNVLSLARP